MPDVDYSKLIGRIHEKGFSQRSLAKKVNISESHFVRKLKGEFPFTQKEIYNICDALSIPASQIGRYFFTKRVEKTKQI